MNKAIVTLLGMGTIFGIIFFAIFLPISFFTDSAFVDGTMFWSLFTTTSCLLIYKIFFYTKEEGDKTLWKSVGTSHKLYGLFVTLMVTFIVLAAGGNVWYAVAAGGVIVMSLAFAVAEFYKNNPE